MRFRYIVFLLLNVVAALPAVAQLRLTAIPSKTIVQRNETFQLQFVAEGASEVDEFIPPSFRNFEVMGERLQSTGWTWVNGTLTEYISYTYQLKSKLTGKLPIASAVAKMKGRAISSNPLVILVTDGPAKTGLPADDQEQKPDYFLAPGENAKDKIAKNLFVKAVVDKQTCVVGEPLLATFKLYTRLDSESKIVKRPSFNGFSVIDLAEPETGVFSREMYNGQVYNTYLIRQVQLFPLQSGQLTIEPVEVENRVRFIRPLPDQVKKDTRKWMDLILEQMKRAELTAENIVDEELVVTSPQLTIQVNELPEEGKPASFTGVVGNFQMNVVLDKSQIRADENGLLKISITGIGNLNLITPPVVNWPGGIEAFEPRSTEQLQTDSGSFSGTKQFEFSFSAVAGTYTLPAIEFSFYNAEKKQYQTLTTIPLKLDVLPAGVQKKEKGLSLQQEVSEERIPAAVLYLAAGLFLVLLCAAAIWLFKWKRRKKAVQPEETVHVNEQIPASYFLQKAEQQLLFTETKVWCSLLQQRVLLYFSNRLGSDDEPLTANAIVQLLQQRPEMQLANACQQFLSSCESVMYNPFVQEQEKEGLLKQAKQLLELADQYFTLRAQTGNQHHGPNESSGDSGYLPRSTS